MPDDRNDLAKSAWPGEILARMAADALATEPTHHAVEYKKHWHTFGELRQVANHVAELIGEAGADRRAIIGFAPRNRPSALAALLGLIAHGRTVQMIYAYQSGAALARNFARLESSILIAAAEDFVPEVIDQLRELGCAGIALTEMAAEFVSGLERVARTVSVAGADQPRIEILTSGTTGPARQWPLGYELLERRFVAANVAYARGMQVDEVPTLVCYSLGNTSGLYGALPNIFHGLPIVLIEKFSLPEWHDYVVRYRPSELFIPPAGMQMLMDSGIPPEDLASGKYMRSGMTHLPIELQRAFEDRYNMPVLLSYGATEFGGVVVQMTLDLIPEWGKKKLGSTGRAIGEARVHVVDQESGEVLPAGQEGLLEVLVPSISPDWQRTSDLARIDEDDFVYILGRADGAIMRGGFKLLPETIEGELTQHPAIAGAAVVGVEDLRLWQVPAAVMELREGAPQPSVAELEDFLRARLPATHIPVVWRFVDTIPRTTSFKIARQEVRTLLEQGEAPDARA